MRALLSVLALSAVLPLPARAAVGWPGGPPCDGTLQACIDAVAAGETIEIATSSPIAESPSFQKSLTLRGVFTNDSYPSFAPGQSLFASMPETGDQRIAIENLVLEGGSIGVAHTTTGSGEIALTGNTVTTGGWEAIRIYTGSGGPPRGPLTVDIAHNRVDMSAGSGERHGILFDLSLATQVGVSLRGNDLRMTGNDQGAVIFLANADGTMTAAVVGNVVWGSGFDTGIFVYQSGDMGSIDATIANNVVTGATIGEGRTGVGIALNGGGSGSLAFEAVNNTSAGNEVGLFVTGRPDLGGTVTGLVANNAFTDDSVYGFGIEGSLWGTVANRHNLDAGNGVSGEGPTYDPGPGTVTTVPAGLEALNFYRPVPASPVRDAGDSSAVPVAVDFDDEARIQGAAVDIGAYELPVPEPGAGAATLAALVSLATLSRTGPRGSRRRCREDPRAATA